MLAYKVVNKPSCNAHARGQIGSRINGVPVGIFQRFFSRFRITTNGAQCMSCGNCSTYCEMGIDVRQYAMENRDVKRAACVGCGMCAHVCPRGVLRLETKADRGPGVPIRVWAMDL